MLGSGWSPLTIGLRKVPSPRSALRWPSSPTAHGRGTEFCAQPGIGAPAGAAAVAAAPAVAPNKTPRASRRVVVTARRLQAQPEPGEDLSARARVLRDQRLIRVGPTV